MKNKNYNNFTLVKALEEVSEDLAVELVSTPDLDPKELTNIIGTSIMGNVINKETKEPLKLSNKVLGAAIINRVNQIAKDKRD